MKIRLSLLFFLLAGCSEPPAEPPDRPVRTALSVAATQVQLTRWPQTLPAAGNIAAWQEAVIGAEISNQRITAVQVQVGDVVKKGQVLARLATDTLDSEVAELRSLVAEAEAVLAEARAMHERSRRLTAQGFYSAQQGLQTQAAAETAQARLQAARARLSSTQLRRSKTVIVAPEAGVISARQATVGSLSQAGQELFRLIIAGRLEWHAELIASELARIQPGQTATLHSPHGVQVSGVVRALAPTVDPHTRSGRVYVDLPDTALQHFSPGMFARGEFQLGETPALVVPQSAVLLREGFSYVFRIDADKVSQIKVTTGRRQGGQVELIGDGLPEAQTLLVAGGVGFLADGDTVRIVPALTTPGAVP